MAILLLHVIVIRVLNILAHMTTIMPFVSLATV